RHGRDADFELDRGRHRLAEPVPAAVPPVLAVRVLTVPSGVYRLADGRAERFSTVDAPAGWSYVCQRDDESRVELADDSRWRPVRCELTTSRWRLRGGSLGRQ